MQIISTAFIKSAARPGGWPETGAEEIAFVGRSNVGKSTLLNVLTHRRALARVSQTPGCTRLINFFQVEALLDGRSPRSLLLADLPGFGYARVSKAERESWRAHIEGYLGGRATLRAVVLLLDSRRAADLQRAPHGLAEEVALHRYILSLGREVIPVMTKADKLGKSARKPALVALSRLLGCKVLPFSAKSREGTDDLWRCLFQALSRKRSEEA